VHRLIALNRSLRSLECAKLLIGVHSPFDRAIQVGSQLHTVGALVFEQLLLRKWSASVAIREESHLLEGLIPCVLDVEVRTLLLRLPIDQYGRPRGIENRYRPLVEWRFRPLHLFALAISQIHNSHEGPVTFRRGSVAGEIDNTLRSSDEHTFAGLVYLEHRVARVVIAILE
jgi:hypothetical protein